LANRELLKAVDREFSGDVRDGMQAIVQCVVNRPAFFAEKLYKSMKGLGTSDSTLIRVVVTRSEVMSPQLCKLTPHPHPTEGQVQVSE
ncbi:hypothetical protein scyTo_0012000, partial [Scyliorhinus torazame]|nr:hypothetical protein [Scyliorhinus torazame]